MPLLALTGAAIFLISCFPIPVPIAGTCSHPCGTPLAAILVGGPFISTVLGAIALLLQALFLAHGGISSWGANILSMAVAGSFVGYGAFILLRKLNVSMAVAAFAAGILGDWATYTVTAFDWPWPCTARVHFGACGAPRHSLLRPHSVAAGYPFEGIFTAGVVVFVAVTSATIIGLFDAGLRHTLMKVNKEIG